MSKKDEFVYEVKYRTTRELEYAPNEILFKSKFFSTYEKAQKFYLDYDKNNKFKMVEHKQIIHKLDIGSEEKMNKNIKKWKYKIEKDLYEVDLNELGKKGWRLVKIVVCSHNPTKYYLEKELKNEE